MASRVGIGARMDWCSGECKYTVFCQEFAMRWWEEDWGVREGDSVKE